MGHIYHGYVSHNERVYVVHSGMRGDIGHLTEVDLDKVDKLQQPHVATSLETMLIKESSPNAWFQVSWIIRIRNSNNPQ